MKYLSTLQIKKTRLKRQIAACYRGVVKGVNGPALRSWGEKCQEQEIYTVSTVNIKWLCKELRLCLVKKFNFLNFLLCLFSPLSFYISYEIKVIKLLVGEGEIACLVPGCKLKNRKKRKYMNMLKERIAWSCSSMPVLMWLI